MREENALVDLCKCIRKRFDVEIGERTVIDPFGEARPDARIDMRYDATMGYHYQFYKREYVDPPSRRVG